MKVLNFQILSLFVASPSKWLRLLLFSLTLTQFDLNPARADFGSIVDLGFAGDLYLTEESANNGQGFVNLLVQNTWTDSQVWLDVGTGGLVGDTANSYIKAPQFFYRQGSAEGLHLSVGRVRKTWSFQDDYWQMGLTQPIFSWNQATPETQGLTGLFLDVPLLNKNYKLTFFVSQLFIPSQGPSFELTNGKLTSSNPWFADPVEIINIAGEKAELNYSLGIPKTQDVIFRHSYGLQLGTEVHKKGFLINAFYMNKPRNDVVLPFEGFLNLSTFNGDVHVLPQVARHEVLGLDLGWNAHWFRTELSWLRESNIRFHIPDETTYPILPTQNIYSIQQSVRLTPTQKIYIGYLHVDRPPSQLGGVFSTANVSTFNSRNRFENVLRLEWQGVLYKSAQHHLMRSTLALYRSFIADNIWASADIKWAVDAGLELFTRCDFFGGSSQDVLAMDFMSSFPNNDRCLVGGHYAF